MAVAPAQTDRLLTFRVGETIFGLPPAQVREVTRMPQLTRVPQAPASLLGLANLRGSVIAVISLARLLDRGDGNPTRIVIVEQGEVLGLAVDDASQLLDAAQRDAVQKLDLASLLVRGLPAPARRPARPAGATAPPAQARASDTVALVAFALAGQEFALPAAVVDEVLLLPADIVPMPDADAVVIGSAAVRGQVLPLLSLRVLLGLPAGSGGARSRVLVVRIGRHRVGLVVDDLRAILQVPSDAIDVVPQVFNRGQGEARIQAICRLDDKRLVSVLAADQLLRAELTAQLLQGDRVEHDDVSHPVAAATREQFLLFRIGGDEFGLAVAAVEEVLPLPARLTRLPRAPAFVQGVIARRGAVIPVIDQAQRFGAQPAATARRRVIIVRTGDLHAGFIVDAVSEVIAIDPADLVPTPELGGDTRLFERVANLPGEQRIVLILTPRELLDRVEQDLLRGFGQDQGAEIPS